MNPLGALLILVTVILGSVAIYAIYRLVRERYETKREQARLDHEKQMKREERDYETVMEYADDDSDDL